MQTRRSILTLAASLMLSLCAGAQAAVVPVPAAVETAPVHSIGDAADDEAIWLHPTDPSLSALIGTDKADTGGLNVYDMAGSELAFRADGRLNNDDLRYNFPLGARRVSLLGGTNRLAHTIDFYEVGTDRSLTKVGAVPVSTNLKTSRGFAMYHSPTSGKYYAFVTDSGKTEQYELSGATGQVTGQLVRRLDVIHNATEGLVADDELGRIYVAEEDIGGVWRFGAEPTDPTAGTRVVATLENGGPIRQDVKGLAIYYGRNRTGYVIAASQGGSAFHLLTREGNAYVGAFKIASGNGIDAVTGEDGIDVTNANAGPLFPQGFFVSTDFGNAPFNQNHKLVPWQAIANAFSPPLIIDTAFDPRSIGAVAATSVVQRRAVSTAVNTTATSSITIPKPAGTGAGNVLVACIALNGSRIPPEGIPGWSRIAANITLPNPRVYGFYRIAGSSEPASYTWSFDWAVTNGGGIARYSGVSTSAPLDAAPSAAAGLPALTGTLPGVTTATPGAKLVGCMGANAAPTTFTIGSPAGMSQWWDIGGKRHELADGTVAAAGASGDKTWKFNSSRAWAGWMTALRPR